MCCRTVRTEKAWSAEKDKRVFVKLPAGWKSCDTAGTATKLTRSLDLSDWVPFRCQGYWCYSPNRWLLIIVVQWERCQQMLVFVVLDKLVSVAGGFWGWLMCFLSLKQNVCCVTTSSLLYLITHRVGTDYFRHHCATSWNLTPDRYLYIVINLRFRFRSSRTDNLYSCRDL